ncbi:metal-dependent hydrolase [Alicyclobacillus sp. SO9]|uniref:metal-dependent hydrolase n=1 Tax=Alicyclobacillus sp. SO9 TaxID=2665646 RepID=UPI001E47169F|nr:metal-dependent hydrolase [Alicyclobacillus sp. SO9]
MTHGLWGLGIYGTWIALAGSEVHTSVAAGVCIAAIVGSEAPDFDYAVRLARGPVSYLRQHRALSHSVPAWFIWPLMIALILSIWWPRQFGVFYLVAFAGVVIHVGLDVLTAYGTQALWPFSKRRWALDALFIVDAVMVVSGFLGWILVLTHVWSAARSVFFFGSLVLVYLAVRSIQAALVHEKVRKQFPSNWAVSTIPGPLPWWWSFVAESERELMGGKVSFSGELSREIHWRWKDRDEKALLFAVRFTRVGSVFHWFARHLVWAQTVEDGQIRISLADATFRFRKTLPFAAYVTLKENDDGRYSVVEQSLRAQEVDWEALAQDAVTADDYDNSHVSIPPAKD